MKSKIYSLKRISFFFFLFLLPCLLFGDFIPTKLLVRRWSGYGVEYGSVNSVDSPVFNVQSEDDIYSILSRSTFGLCINLVRRQNNFGVIVPPRTTNVVFSSSINSLNITNSLRGSVDGNVCIASVARYDKIFGLYSSVAALYYNGYNGSGFDGVFESAEGVCLNVNYPVLLADVFSSTNTVFRQILLGHLNSIQSSVVNIDTGVSALVPSVDRIADINSSIATNSFDAVSLLRNIDTNFSSAVSSILDVNPRLDSVTNLLELLHNDSVTGNLDVLLGDDTASWVGYCNWAYSQGLLGGSERDYFILEFQETDPSLPLSRSYSIPVSHRRFLAKSSLQGRVVAANQLRGIYQSMGYVPTGSGPWAQEAISDIGSYFTRTTRTEINYLSGRVEDWREGLRQQLQDWKTSDEHGILNVKNKIDDVDSAIKKNFEFKPNSLLTNTIPYTAFVTNFVVVPVTNSVNDAAGQISSNVVEQGQSTRDYLAENLFDPTAGGAYVNIRFPIYGEHQKAVHVHDDALDVFGSGIDELNYNVDAILGDMNSRWSEWFRRWDDFAPPVHSNIEAILKVLLNWTNTTAQLNHVLFYDYSNYVHSASYDDLFSTLENDYPSCYSNLVKFGLSSSADGGRWWNVLSSSVSYDTAMLSYVFSDMVELDRIARDNLGESPFSFLQRTLSDMPSKSQIEDYVSQASNATSEVEYALSSLSNSLAVVSNSIDSVFNPFRGHFDSPGSSVTFFKIHDGHDGQYVTIPVSDQSDAWRYIRLGVSFGLVAVNLLLFPKYLLMLFTLFIKAYRIGIKFFPDDR